MTRPDVSYEMTVEGPLDERRRFNEALMDQGYIPDYFELMPAEGPEDIFMHYMTPEHYGTTEQWTELDESMGSLISAFPTLKISIWENDEEPHVMPRRLDYANGSLICMRYGCCHAPDDEWAQNLLVEVMGELGKRGHFDAVALIRSKYNI